MLVGHFFKNLIFSKRAGALIKRISWLSLVGISISVTAFLTVLFVMNGMNATIKKRILGLEPHLYVQASGMTSPESLESHPVMQRLKEYEGTKAYVYETQDVILRSQDGQFRGGIARGVTAESLEHFINSLQNLDRKESHRETYFWDPSDIPQEGEILMGVDLAQSLGVFEGDFVTIVSPTGLLLPPGETPKFERVRIKKIITTSLSDVDAQYIYYQRGVTLNALALELQQRNFGVEVWLSNEKNLEPLKKDLEKFDGVSVETWMDRNSALLYALKLEKLTIGTFLGLAGIVAASSILTVLALLLSQKRRDIAILRTIGLSGKETVKTFALMGFSLGFSGVLIGVIVGTGVGLYLQSYPLKLADSAIYYDPSIPALVDYGLVVAVLFVSAVVAGLGAYIPARTAASVKPSDALRVK